MAETNTNGNGSRSVTNSDLQRELRILNTEINGKLDLMIQASDYAEKAQAVLRVDVDKGADEILTLRQRTHDLANGVQALEARTAPLSFALANELVGMIPDLRHGVELVRRSDSRSPLNQAETDSLRDLLKNDASREIAYVKRLRDEVDALVVLDQIKAVLARNQRRDARWLGLPHEVVGGVIALFIFLTLTTIWALIRVKYLNLPA